jgi:hypothetical protein
MSDRQETLVAAANQKNFASPWYIDSILTGDLRKDHTATSDQNSNNDEGVKCPISQCKKTTKSGAAWRWRSK